MSCCECPWKNPPKIEFQTFFADGMQGLPPKRGTKNSSGIDVFIPKGFEERYNVYSTRIGQTCCPVYPGYSILIPLNIKIKIPEGFDIEVKNKSGISTKMSLIKGAELIDNDYRGNIMIHLFNVGSETRLLKDEMKITQLVVRPVLISDWVEVEYIDVFTERCEGGFGSTGDK